MVLIVAQMPREVRYVRDALKKEFESLIDMSDTFGSADQVEVHFLSRALAALIARKLLGCSSKDAADSLVDGFKDEGIDAIAIADSGTRLWLIQSKWSEKGSATFGKGEALKFGHGLELLDSRKFSHFNHRVQARADLIGSAWDTATQVTLVVATMGSASLSMEVTNYFDYLQSKYNEFSSFLDYEAWDARRILQIVRDDNAEPAIEIIAPLDQWMHLAEPFEAYQGRLSASEVSEWFEAHGDRLFEQNIRKSLGLTRVNQALVETLKTNPQDFWYFNNGITVLCESTEHRAFSKATYSPIEVTMTGASVVNGAQTVTAIHTAMQEAPEQAAQAYVSLKIVTTRNTSGNFGESVTRATNTQNQVERRDFAALDRVQWQIREDFTLTLHKQYAFKRGELEPAPDVGVSLTNAALALACAHSNVDLTVRAKINRDTLWEDSPQGTYSILFHRGTPSAIQIWRSVQVLRAVQSWLAHGQGTREGRANSIATSGDLFVTHLVFQNLALDSIDDLDYDWDAELARIPDLAAAALGWLIYRVDAAFGPTSVIKSTFQSIERTRILAKLVLADMASGGPLPELPAEYVPVLVENRPRRPNAVQTLVNSQWVDEGTPVIFQMRSQSEREAIGAWLAVDDARRLATWVNHRSKPLLWALDRQQYSPTGLVKQIWEQAGWQNHPVAVQGPDRWEIPGQGALWEIAFAIQDEAESAEDEA